MASPIDELLSMPVEERAKLKWNDERLAYVADKLEDQYGIPKGVLQAIKYAENTYIDKADGTVKPSENTSEAKSEKGAEGLMQIMPTTREKLQGGLFQHNPLDPVESLDAAARYVNYTLNKQYKGDVLAVIADYNGGPSAGKNVLKNKQPPSKETRDYLKKARHFFETWKSK